MTLRWTRLLELFPAARSGGPPDVRRLVVLRETGRWIHRVEVAGATADVAAVRDHGTRDDRAAGVSDAANEVHVEVQLAVTAGAESVGRVRRIHDHEPEEPLAEL